MGLLELHNLRKRFRILNLLKMDQLWLFLEGWNGVQLEMSENNIKYRCFIVALGVFVSFLTYFAVGIIFLPILPSLMTPMLISFVQFILSASLLLGLLFKTWYNNLKINNKFLRAITFLLPVFLLVFLTPNGFFSWIFEKLVAIFLQQLPFPFPAAIFSFTRDDSLVWLTSLGFATIVHFFQKRSTALNSSNNESNSSKNSLLVKFFGVAASNFIVHACFCFLSFGLGADDRSMILMFIGVLAGSQSPILNAIFVDFFGELALLIVLFLALFYAFVCFTVSGPMIMLDLFLLQPLGVFIITLFINLPIISLFPNQKMKEFEELFRIKDEIETQIAVRAGNEHNLVLKTDIEELLRDPISFEILTCPVQLDIGRTVNDDQITDISVLTEIVRLSLVRGNAISHPFSLESVVTAGKSELDILIPRLDRARQILAMVSDDQNYNNREVNPANNLPPPLPPPPLPSPPPRLFQLLSNVYALFAQNLQQQQPAANPQANL